MANKTITIRWNNGKPQFSPPPGVTHLRFGDTVTVQLTGGTSAGAAMEKLTIYGNKVGSGGNEKNPADVRCVFPGGTQDTCSLYELVSFDSDAVVFKNIDEIPPSDPPATYWFGVSGSPGDWSLDPELQNEPDSGTDI